MRQFVVRSHTLSTDTDVSLDDLPGAGRLDLFARCVTGALLCSHDSRSNVRLSLCVDDYTIEFDGSEIRRLNPDERSTAARIRDALAASPEAIGSMPATPSPGVSIRQATFASLIEDLGSEGTLVELHAEGEPIVEREPPENPVFVLSDHRQFTDDEAGLLRTHADDRRSLGPRALHADQAITVVHNYLDTDGYTQY